MTEWKPIETAPKEDEQKLLLLTVFDKNAPRHEFHNYETAIHLGFWGVVKLGEKERWLDYWDISNGEFQEIYPKYWMPLPEPPK